MRCEKSYEPIVVRNSGPRNPGNGREEKTRRTASRVMRPAKAPKGALGEAKGGTGRKSRREVAERFNRWSSKRKGLAREGTSRRWQKAAWGYRPTAPTRGSRGVGGRLRRLKKPRSCGERARG